MEESLVRKIVVSNYHHSFGFGCFYMIEEIVWENIAVFSLLAGSIVDSAEMEVSIKT